MLTQAFLLIYTFVLLHEQAKCCLCKCIEKFILGSADIRAVAGFSKIKAVKQHSYMTNPFDCWYWDHWNDTINKFKIYFQVVWCRQKEWSFCAVGSLSREVHRNHFYQCSRLFDLKSTFISTNTQHLNLNPWHIVNPFDQSQQHFSLHLKKSVICSCIPLKSCKNQTFLSIFVTWIY